MTTQERTAAGPSPAPCSHLPKSERRRCIEREDNGRLHAVNRLRQAIYSARTQFDVCSVCNHITARSCPPNAGARRCEGTEIELRSPQTLREPPCTQLWPTIPPCIYGQQGLGTPDQGTEKRSADQPSFSSCRPMDVLRCLLARATFGILEE